MAALSRRHSLGAALVLVSTVFFSLTGVLTKSIQADAWTIVGWRGFVGGLAVLGYVVLAQRRAGRPIDLKLGARGWQVALVSALASLLFITAFKFTSVAHVVVIYATVPFMAAAAALAAMGERFSWRTLLASAVALVGVAVTVSGGGGAATVSGDALALGMTFLCAVYLVMVRAFRDTPTVWASGVASFLLMIPSAVMGDFAAVSVHDGLLMSLFGLTFAAAVVLWTEGARLIPPAEAGLLGAVEIPLALLFAWLLLSEPQTLAGLGGGAVVLLAVGAHALADHRRSEEAASS